MSTTTFGRAVAAGAATVTVATTLAAAPAADAAAAPTHRAPHATATAHRAVTGFRPVRTVAGSVEAMHSPAQGQLWIAVRAADGSLQLQRKDGRAWRTYRLPAAASAQEGAVDLHGVGRNDVWLTAGGKLWHFDGRRWRAVATPTGARAVTVADVRGPSVYVGMTGDEKTTGVYRFDGRRWSSMGRPSEADWPYPVPLHRPTDLQVVGGKVFANWSRAARSSSMWWYSYVYENGRWVKEFETQQYGSGTYSRATWVVPNASTQLALGSAGGDHDLPWFTRCSMWKSSGEVTACATRFATGAATALPDGRVVIGGDDYREGATGPRVEGAFGIRAADGTERTVPGDPGDRTLEMAAEPGGRVVWAVTTKNGVQTLQSWTR